MTVSDTAVRSGEGWKSIARRLAPTATSNDAAAEYLARANGNTMTTILQVGRILFYDPAVLAAMTPVPVPSSPSGQAMPTGNLPGWRQVFVDDFNTDIPLGQFPAATAGRWYAYSGWGDTWTKAKLREHAAAGTTMPIAGRGRYSSELVNSVKGGVMSNYLHITADGVVQCAGIGPVLPGGQRAMLYGRYSIRARTLGPIPGWKIAWLTWPHPGTWPADGELDFPECSLDETVVGGFVHHKGATSGSDQTVFRAPIDLTLWHTYTIEWSPGKVVYILDGKPIGTSTTRIPNTPMRWCIQSEGNMTDASRPKAGVSGTIEMDWVTVHAYDPTVT